MTKKWIVALSMVFILLGVLLGGLVMRVVRAGSSEMTIHAERADTGEDAGNVKKTAGSKNGLSQKRTAAIESKAGVRVNGKKKSVWEQKAIDIYDRNTNLLVLVNADNELKESYDASLRTICNGRLSASGRLYSSLVKMFADAREQGYTYWIASAWRSRQKQQKLIEEDVRDAMQRGLSREEALAETYRETMPVGHSEHETGLALDILCSGNTNMDCSQQEEPGNIWLQENSWRYGFILRYPQDKEQVTGISYEPWHFRYVGKEAAKYMHKHHLTLEEFWELLE